MSHTPSSKSFYSINGNSQKLDGGAMFGNAPKALWQRWTDVDELNRIPLVCRAMLVQDGDKIILTKGDLYGAEGGTNAMKIVKVGAVAGGQDSAESESA